MQNKAHKTTLRNNSLQDAIKPILEKGARFLQDKMRQWPLQTQRACFVIFLTCWCSASLYALISPFQTQKPSFVITPIRLPASIKQSPGITPGTGEAGLGKPLYKQKGTPSPH